MIYILIVSLFLLGWTVCMIHDQTFIKTFITKPEDWFHQIVLSTMRPWQGSPNKTATADASKARRQWWNSAADTQPVLLLSFWGLDWASSNILELNTSENGGMDFACTRLVLSTNSMQSLHDGDRWTWQDHLALQVHTCCRRVFNSNDLHPSGWSWARPSQQCRRQDSMWSLWGTRALISKSGKEEGGAWLGLSTSTIIQGRMSSCIWLTPQSVNCLQKWGKSWKNWQLQRI